MNKMKYIFLILVSITIQTESYSQIDEVYESIVLSEGECEFEYIKQTNYLRKSFESVPILKFTKKIKFIDQNGKTHKFSSKSEKLPIWCEYNWICKFDSTQSQKYFVSRPTYRNSFTSKSIKLKIEYYLSTVVNEKYPKNCSDIFYMSITPIDSETISTNVVIDRRTNTTGLVEEFIFHTEINIDGTIYNDVYEETIDDYQLFYNLELGLIKLKNQINSQILKVKN